MATRNDIEVALNSGSIEQLDKAKLEELAAVEPSPSGSPTYYLRFQQAQLRISRALERIHAKEREEKEENRHRIALQVASGANRVAKWSVVIAVLALIVAVVQTFWR